MLCLFDRTYTFCEERIEKPIIVGVGKNGSRDGCVTITVGIYKAAKFGGVGAQCRLNIVNGQIIGILESIMQNDLPCLLTGNHERENYLTQEYSSRGFRGAPIDLYEVADACSLM